MISLQQIASGMNPACVWRGPMFFSPGSLAAADYLYALTPGLCTPVPGASPPALLAPLETDIDKAVRAFLVALMPPTVEVIKGQINRVPEPKSLDFIVFWELRRDRLATNIDDFIDTRFLGYIVLGVLTVTSLTYGSIVPGRQLFGVGVDPNSLIIKQLTGTPGGIGTYQVSGCQTVMAGVFAAGVAALMQETQVTYQLDVHGPQSTNNAQIISTVWRDDKGVQLFGGDSSAISPFYADDPRFIPFINGEQQTEFRWVVEAVLQANQVVTLPQQFAEALAVGLIDVDAVYPP